MCDLKWWQKSIVYQVYPKSFNDTTGSGTGDLNGVTEKLDYLKTLGTGAIWLTPIYPSPMVDNGYDIADYTAIDPAYGTMADFDRLVAEAKQRDIRVVMDLVYNHTSDQHPWFQESKSSRDNVKADWYIWRDAKQDGSAPTNWRSIFGGSAWTWCEERQQYYLHTFAEQQPDLNWENPEVRQALYDAANFWLKKGVGGFRIDAIVYIKKPQKFVDGEPDGADGMVNIHKMIANTDGILDFLHEFRREVFDGHDIFTVAEANGVGPKDLPKWVGKDGAFSMLFEFDHVSLEFTDGEIWYKATGYTKDVISGFKKCLSASQKATQSNGWYPIFFENHDQFRSVRHFFPDDADAKVTAKTLATILYTLRGTPFVFEGEELGFDNVAWKHIDDYNDISSHGQYELAREGGLSDAEAMKCIHRYSRDNARTPMQWNDSENAGFTTGKPWLPVHDDYKACNVAAEEADATSVLRYYQQLASLRSSGEVGQVLHAGDYTELLPERQDMYAFKRQYDKLSTITLANFTDKTVLYSKELAQGDLLIGTQKEPKKGILRPYEAVVYFNREG